MNGIAICALLFIAMPIVSPDLLGAEPTLADIPPSAPPELKRFIEQTFASEPAVRGNAAEQVGSMGEAAAPAVPFLIRLLSDRAEFQSSNIGACQVGVYALSALERIGKPSIGPCIAALRDSRDRHCTMDLIDILAHSKDPKAIEAVIPFINGPDEKLSSTTLMLLDECKDPQLVAPLVKALATSHDSGVRLGVRVVCEMFAIHEPSMRCWRP